MLNSEDISSLNYKFIEIYFHYYTMPFIKDYNNDEINDIIDEAWEIGWFKSNITFKSIFNKWGLDDENLNILMSKHLDTKSFNQWQKKIERRR